MSLRPAKVRPDGIETDVALVVDRLVAKVEGQEVRGVVGEGACWGRGVWAARGGEGGGKPDVSRQPQPTLTTASRGSEAGDEP